MQIKQEDVENYIKVYNLLAKTNYSTDIVHLQMDPRNDAIFYSFVIENSTHAINCIYKYKIHHLKIFGDDRLDTFEKIRKLSIPVVKQKGML